MPRVTLKSRLPQIAASIRPRVGAAVKQAAEAVAEDARQRVPLGPPSVHIKDHIRVERREAAGYHVIADAEDPQGRPYAAYVEFGTNNRAATPFLIPALEANAENAENLVRAALRGL